MRRLKRTKSSFHLSLFLSAALMTASCRERPRPVESADIQNWIISSPTQPEVLARLGTPQGTTGSGIQTWRYDLDGGRTLRVGWWASRPPHLAYSNLSADNKILWEEKFDTHGIHQLRQ